MPRIKRQQIVEEKKELLQVSVKLRELFGLKQADLASLLSTTTVTISAWETRGVVRMSSNKPTIFTNLIQFISLVRQSRKDSRFLSFDKLKAYVETTVRGDLHKYYERYRDHMDEHFFYTMKSTNLNALLFALYFDRYLESMGIETPEKKIMAGEKSPEFGDFLSVDMIISSVDGLTDEEVEDAPFEEPQSESSGPEPERKPSKKGIPPKKPQEQEKIEYEEAEVLHLPIPEIPEEEKRPEKNMTAGKRSRGRKKSAS